MAIVAAIEGILKHCVEVIDGGLCIDRAARNPFTHTVIDGKTVVRFHMDDIIPPVLLNGDTGRFCRLAASRVDPWRLYYDPVTGWFTYG